MATQSDLPAVGSVIDKYQVTGVLGQGGMGIVYSAVHRGIEAEAAIKVLSPEAAADHTLVERFLQEARAANRVGHPAIVKIFDNGRLANGLPYLVMERLRGMSLAGYLFNHNPNRLDLRTALTITEAILEPLQEAHQAGIIHRDIKPDNLFLLDRFLKNPGETSGFLKILDFGIARIWDGPGLGTANRVLGTADYMAPEQIGGKIDPRADLYAVGAVLYEMLTGHVPHEANGFDDL